MDFTIKAKGPSFERLIADTTRDLKRANRTAGRDISKVGLAAMRDGAPRMWGRRLRVKSKVQAWADRCNVLFFPWPKNAGGWAIQESGHRGGYTVKPRRAKALHGGFTGGFATVTHPGRAAGNQAWTKAGQRLAKALDRTIEHVYSEALNG